MNKKITSKDLIEKQIRDTINNTTEEGDTAREILRTLGRSGVIRYDEDQQINLLSAPGKALNAILEDRSFTARALAIYLGVTEQAMARSLKMLIDAKLVKREKVNRRYVYLPITKEIAEHRDIAPFLKMEKEEKPF
jgi:DNA-binding MarR family transcriptional regulator